MTSAGIFPMVLAVKKIIGETPLVALKNVTSPEGANGNSRKKMIVQKASQPVCAVSFSSHFKMNGD